jgi:hypothetical protein
LGIKAQDMIFHRGWIRLGLVTSAIWVGIVCVGVAYEYFNATPTSAHLFIEYVPGTTPDPEHPDIIWDIPSVKLKSVLLATFPPVALMWLLGAAVSWVRAGFK